MQFTTQQLSGGGKYGALTKLGNWSEDDSRTELALKDYAQRKASGGLLHARKEQERSVACAPVPFEPTPPQQELTYGASVQLVHERTATVAAGATHFVLASNRFTVLAPGHIAVFAVPNDALPQARNVFSVHRSCGAPAGATDEGTVRFGDQVVLQAHPALTSESSALAGLPLVLASQSVNSLTGCGDKKGRQEVTCSLLTAPSAEALWSVLHASGDQLETAGQPVRCGDEVQLVHVLTNAALACAPAEVVHTGIGQETAAGTHCHTYRPAAHVSMGLGGDLPVTRPDTANVWRLVIGNARSTSLAADAASTAAASDQSLSRARWDSVVQRIRAKLLSANGVHGLRSLRIALGGRTPTAASFGDVRAALVAHGVALSEAEYQLLAQQCSAATLEASSNSPRAGAAVDVAVLLAALRGGALNDSRKHAVRKAWAVLEAAEKRAAVAAGTVPGAVRLSTLLANYTPPSWERGSPAEALTEFARQWPSALLPHSGGGATTTKPGATPAAPVASAALRYSDFEDYYDDTSVEAGGLGIDGADPFDAALDHAWGGGAAAGSIGRYL